MSDEAKPGGGAAKPVYSAITSTLCTCGYLERASDEPAVPIVFDGRMNEYHLTNVDLDGKGRRGYSIIFHCLNCGGAAPKSKRDMLFAHITDAESRRLSDLAAGVKTVEDALGKFGQPDEDHPHGLTTKSPASDTEPSVVRSYRVLRYRGLSETAHVTFTDYGPERGLHMTLESKYVGEPKATP